MPAAAARPRSALLGIVGCPSARAAPTRVWPGARTPPRLHRLGAPPPRRRPNPVRRGGAGLPPSLGRIYQGVAWRGSPAALAPIRCFPPSPPGAPGGLPASAPAGTRSCGGCPSRASAPGPRCSTWCTPAFSARAPRLAPGTGAGCPARARAPAARLPLACWTAAPPDCDACTSGRGAPRPSLPSPPLLFSLRHLRDAMAEPGRPSCSAAAAPMRGHGSSKSDAQTRRFQMWTCWQVGLSRRLPFLSVRTWTRSRPRDHRPAACCQSRQVHSVMHPTAPPPLFSTWTGTPSVRLERLLPGLRPWRLRGAPHARRRGSGALAGRPGPPMAKLFCL